MVEFCVSDNGEGIERKHFSTIFKIFQSLNPDAGENASGIGLTLVKKLVERNGGRIRVDSVFGTGTSFFFTMPEPNVKGIYQHEKTLLIIDANTEFVSMAAKMFEKAGVRALHAKSVRDACALLEADAGCTENIILDADLPDEDVVKAFNELKAINSQFKIFASSGSEHSMRAMTLKNAGVEAVIVKPYTASDIAELFEATEP